MIQDIPDDNMFYVIRILQNLSSEKQQKDLQQAKTALKNILSMEKRLPYNFDPTKELQEARKEKYDNFG